MHMLSTKKTKGLLVRPLKTTKATTKARVTDAKTLFAAKSLVLAPPNRAMLRTPPQPQNSLLRISVCYQVLS